MILLIVAIAIMLTYILAIGWNFEFTKRQFGFLILILILGGMFIEAWLRETGDELLILLALVLVNLVVLIPRMLRRRKSRGPR